MKRSESSVAVDGEIPHAIDVDGHVHSAGSVVVYRELLFHLTDGLKIFFKTTPLIGELLHGIFERLKAYDRSPSESAQETWIGFCVMGIAAALTLSVKILNYRHAQKNPGHYLAAEDYLYSLFSCSFFYYGFDLLSGVVDISAMPISLFMLSNFIGLPMVGALFFKFASPDSSDRLICPWAESFRPPVLSSTSVAERCLNGVKSAKDAAVSVAAFLWVVNREFHGKTVPLNFWQIEFIFLFLLVAIKIGYEMTRHPKFFQAFMASLKLFEDGALTYATLSGLFFMIAVYQCDDHSFCLDTLSRQFLTQTAFFIALAFGLFSAAMTEVRFQEHHDSTKKIITAMTDASETLSTYKKTVTDGLSNCVHFFREKISRCCASTEMADDASERGPLIVEGA